MMARRSSQFFISRATSKVPPVIHGVDAQVGAQHQGVRLRTIGVPFRLVKNVDLLDDGTLLIGQERPVAPRPARRQP